MQECASKTELIRSLMKKELHLHSILANLSPYSFAFFFFIAIHIYSIHLQSPPKVLEQQGQFLCFCYTLMRIKFEAYIRISAFISWYFYQYLLSNLGPPNV